MLTQLASVCVVCSIFASGMSRGKGLNVETGNVCKLLKWKFTRSVSSPSQHSTNHVAAIKGQYSGKTSGKVKGK